MAFSSDHLFSTSCVSPALDHSSVSSFVEWLLPAENDASHGSIPADSCTSLVGSNSRRGEAAESLKISAFSKISRVPTSFSGAEEETAESAHMLDELKRYSGNIEERSNAILKLKFRMDDMKKENKETIGQAIKDLEHQVEQMAEALHTGDKKLARAMQAQSAFNAGLMKQTEANDAGKADVLEKRIFDNSSTAWEVMHDAQNLLHDIEMNEVERGAHWVPKLRVSKCEKRVRKRRGH